MIRLALRSLAARPLRTALTALAVVLGVAMVSAAFTITDTMRGAADSLSRAAATADRVLFIADGRIVGDLASPAEDQIIDVMRGEALR